MNEEGMNAEESVLWDELRVSLGDRITHWLWY